MPGGWRGDSPPPPRRRPRCCCCCSLDEVAALLGRGEISVNVSHKYSLEQAGEAFQVLATRQVIGKLLICPQPVSML